MLPQSRKNWLKKRIRLPHFRVFHNAGVITHDRRIGPFYPIDGGYRGNSFIFYSFILFFARFLNKCCLFLFAGESAATAGEAF
jgi:hypothetical protein